MPKITRLTAITLAALSTLTTVSRDTGWPTYPAGNLNRSELERTFANPADVQTSCYWYWISGNVSPEGVVEDVRAMKRAGINRAFMGFQGLEPNEASHGPVYIQTPEWYKCVRNAMRTATEEGVEIGVFNCPGWSQSGGPWVKPEESQRFLAFADTIVKMGENPLKIRLARPDNYLSDMAVIVRPADDYRSVSVYVAGKANRFVINAPDNGMTLRSAVLTTAGPVLGEFTVSAYVDDEWKPVKKFAANRTNMMIEVGYDRTAPTVASVTPVKADKFRIDYKVNADVNNAVLTFSERPLLEAYPDKILSKMYQQPLPFWEQYKWEPCVSDRFLWDMRRMLADRLAYDHIGGLRKLANKDGYKLWLEPYGHWGYPGEFLMYSGQSDEVSGEFWSEGSLGDIENRVASSVAHTYGKGRCSAESFTVGGPEYTRSPRTYKERGDRFFAEGINSTLLHLFISQSDSTSLPGMNCPFGNEFNRKNTFKDAATGDLSLSSDDAVKYFAGTMTYTNTFKMPKLAKGKRVELNLGEVREMAEVYVNGQKAGGVWTAPYTLDITDFVKKGRNKITVKVVNNWNNRLIGDAQKPAEQRRTSYPYHYLKPESPLQPAGLLGPVEICQY